MFTKHSTSQPKAAAGRQLEKQFPLQQYLLMKNYQQVSTHVYIKDDSPEIIRVTRRQGRTFFRNFLLPADKGSVLDFLCHRLHTPGKIIPNTDQQTLERAVEAATHFITVAKKPSKDQSRFSC